MDVEKAKKMSVAKLAEMMREVIEDDKFYEMNRELFDLDPSKNYKEFMETFETFIRSSRYKDKAGFDMNTLAGFYNGTFFGMAIVTKINFLVQGKSEDEFKKAIKLLGTFYLAIEEGAKNIKDDKWFENLMKNVKVVPALPEKKDKKRKK